MKPLVFSRLMIVCVAAGFVGACQPVNEASETVNKGPHSDAEIPALFQIAAATVSCVGVAPMRCLVVNGELFYDGIEGYSHQEGVSRTLRVKRTQICDPAILNNCPQDVGIYKYSLIEIVE